MKNSHFNVSPRYTPGSPAMVDEDTAVRVAAEERRAYERALSGRYGTEEQDRALKLGVSGVVESRAESRRSWIVLDMITGERFERPFKRVA